MDAYEAPSVVEFNAQPSDLSPSDRQKPRLISIVVCIHINCLLTSTIHFWCYQARN